MSEFPERAISGLLDRERAEKFAAYLTNHTQAGPGTVKKYLRIVRGLLKRDPFSLETAAAYCKRKNRSYVRASIVKYIEFMDHQGELPEWGPGSADYLIKKLPKVHEPPAKPRKLADLQELMDVIEQLDGDYKYAALFMLYTGARSEEAMGVKLKDLEEDGDVTIYGKGKIEKAPRTVKIPPEFLKKLLGRLRARGILGGEYVFLSDSSASLESRTRMFRKEFGKVSRKVLGRSLGAHEFRRFAATAVYEDTRDAKAVKEFLGHSKIDTTERYIRFADRNKILERGRDIITEKTDRFYKDRGEISRPEGLKRPRKRGFKNGDHKLHVRDPRS